MPGVKITEHAYQRAKERLGFGRAAVDKMASKAFYDGVVHKQAKGRLKKYFDRLYFEYRTANNIRVYGENVFLFSGQTLITVYQLPNDLKKLASKSKTCAEKQS